MTLHRNIVSWAIIRAVAQNFGLQFRSRISLYTSSSFLIVLVLLVALIVELFSSKPSVTTISYAFINSVMICTLLAIMLYRGTQANDEFIRHKSIITRIQTAIRERLSVRFHGSEAKHAIESLNSIEYLRLQQCDLMLDSVLKTLEIDSELNPVTLLGIRASRQLAGSVLTVMGSAITVVIRLLSQ
eukprot:TRINITY_DN12292_c0_g1_i4.p1 TRINITY_DN12292_c0_g1~~TRINITY_DN12292_c0_g1_i4.p1  ORF type:complete len:203 (-),score=29.80 TRINITY_DN12292_c0_g1_i4:283-840(-)